MAGYFLPELMAELFANALVITIVLVVVTIFCLMSLSLWTDSIGITDEFIEQYNLFGKVVRRFYWSDIVKAGHMTDSEGTFRVSARVKSGKSIYWIGTISNFKEITDLFIEKSGFDVYVERLELFS